MILDILWSLRSVAACGLPVETIELAGLRDVAVEERAHQAVAAVDELAVDVVPLAPAPRPRACGSRSSRTSPIEMIVWPKKREALRRSAPAEARSTPTAVLPAARPIS